MTKQTLKAILLSVSVVAAVALASNVTLPNTFVNGTPAVAAQVNANFTAVKTAVDDNHSRITALETVPAFTAATLMNGWDNVGAPWAIAGFTKDAMGFVHMRGLLRRNTGTSGNIFQVPVGYRPAATLQFPARCGNDVMCYIHVNANGNVDFGGPASADPSTSVTLDGIIYDLR